MNAGNSPVEKVKISLLVSYEARYQFSTWFSLVSTIFAAVQHAKLVLLTFIGAKFFVYLLTQI